METPLPSEPKQKLFKLERSIYQKLTTLGNMFKPDGTRFSFTLEDVVRATGIKDKGFTAIPAGIYRMTVTRSQKFGRDMVLIFNQPDMSLQADGIRFDGIRVHGGNTHADTSGCVLVAKNKLSDESIQGTMEKEFTALVKSFEDQGYECFIEIINLPQAA